ncbi:MAG: hypothetical protein AAF639_25295 [Chloroflexota bacterium]
MAYSDFKTFDHVQSKFPITISTSESLFADVAEVETSTLLQEVLNVNIPLALKISTEKARSELIVMQVLVEVYKLFDLKLGVFSGVDFNVDSSIGLTGYCDYILSHSPNTLTISAPVFCMVEAKNLDLSRGYPQCIVEMIAAQKFNAQKANDVELIWGAVTTGTNWRFLRLNGNDVCIDFDEYHISQINKILGIFLYMLGR